MERNNSLEPLRDVLTSRLVNDTLNTRTLEIDPLAVEFGTSGEGTRIQIIKENSKVKRNPQI